MLRGHEGEFSTWPLRDQPCFRSADQTSPWLPSITSVRSWIHSCRKHAQDMAKMDWKYSIMYLNLKRWLRIHAHAHTQNSRTKDNHSWNLYTANRISLWTHAHHTNTSPVILPSRKYVHLKSAQKAVQILEFSIQLLTKILLHCS
jgi:hypothetical protein